MWIFDREFWQKLIVFETWLIIGVLVLLQLVVFALFVRADQWHIASGMGVAIMFESWWIIEKEIRKRSKNEERLKGH